MRLSNNSCKSAISSWVATKQEELALENHIYVEGLGRVDQIWHWLKANHGNLLALDAPHATHPEKYNYSQLSDIIDISASAFKSFGIEKGDVIGLFSENSPRWLIADQGIMRVDAIDAVRGASAPIEELRYILEDSKAIALVVQTAELFHEIQLSQDQKSRLKLILQLEGEPAEGTVGWDSFLARGSLLKFVYSFIKYQELKTNSPRPNKYMRLSR